MRRRYKNNGNKKGIILAFLFLVNISLFAQVSTHAYIGNNGKLVYDADSMGNTIPDFSQCGYMRNNEQIPTLPVKKTISPISGDNGAHIQAAIDEVSALPIDENGFRGTVLLTKGTYYVEGSLSLNASGVVLRGEGDGDDGTIIIGTGTRKRPLVRVDGGGNRNILEDTKVQIMDDYLPVGATSFTVNSAEGYNVGDKIVVFRKATDAWIKDIGMDKYGWEADEYDFYYEREITAIENERIIIDVPIVMMIEGEKYTPGFIYKYEHTGRIQQVGVEDIQFQSTYQSEQDEDHATNAVRFDNIRDGWLRRSTAKYFYDGIVNINDHGKFITVTDCQSLDPKSKIDGGRRYPYDVGGAMCLVINCYSRNGRHDFVQGSRVEGPNAFVNCRADLSHEDTGPHHRWSTGTLFDNVKVPGHSIAVQDRGSSGSGHGWTGAQIVFWNVEADVIVCQAAPGSINWSIGSVGEIHPGTFFTDRPQGIWEHHGTHVKPTSLFYQQLADRMEVKPPDVTGITLKPESATLYATETVELTETVIPFFAANKNVTWSSDNLAVAKVDTNGLVTAVSEGNATITVATEQFDSVATSEITVIPGIPEKNVALNKSVTASDDDGNGPGNLVDGDLSGTSRWSANGFPQWAEIDLGSTYSINKTEVTCYGNRAYQFIIEAKTESGSYVIIVDRSNNTTPGKKNSPIIDEFPPIDARYVKITVSGASGYNGPWMSLTELKVIQQQQR